MTSDEMMEHDELFRAESEANRERKANGDTSPAQTDKPAKAKRSRREKTVFLSHEEMAILRVYRGITEWLDGGTTEQRIAVREWLGSDDNIDQAMALLTAIFTEFDKAIKADPTIAIAATVSHRDAGAQGGVQ